jgi:hypothetical protein
MASSSIQEPEQPERKYVQQGRICVLFTDVETMQSGIGARLCSSHYGILSLSPVHPSSLIPISLSPSLSLSLSECARRPSPDVDKATLATNQAGMPVLAALPPIHP